MTTKEEAWIMEIAAEISWPIMCEIAVKYMGFRFDTLETFWLEEKTSEGANKKVLVKFKNELKATERATIKQVGQKI